MNKTEAMVAAYLEAIYATETGDNDQPPVTAELTPLTKCQAYIDCRSFLAAIGGNDPSTASTTSIPSSSDTTCG